MKLIKLNGDHYVVVDDSEINEGDYCLMFDDYGNLFLGNQPKQYLGEKSEHYLNKGLRKVTRSTKPLESIVTENSFKTYEFISLQEVKEVIGEADVEKKANEEYKDNLHNPFFTAAPMGYIKGYKQCLEDNREKKYTEDDMRRAYMVGKHGGVTQTYYEFDDYIQSLQPKPEWEVEMVDGKLKLR